MIAGALVALLLDFRGLWLSSIDLCRQGRFQAAAPIARECVRLQPNAWQTHQHLAAILQNASTEPRVRSSFERQRMVRESLHEFEIAARLVDGPDARRFVLMEWGKVYSMWLYSTAGGPGGRQ